MRAKRMNFQQNTGSRLTLRPLFRLGLALVAALCAWTLGLGVAQAVPHYETKNAYYIHKKGNALLAWLIHDQLSSAAKQGQGVVLMFTADWCSPCKAIKQMAVGSAVVRKSLTKGRLLYIDVDEWRGPAQALLPGVDVSKLPTLVHVDSDLKAGIKCYGTDLGLLSEDAVAHNLERLLANQAPEKPFYTDKPDVERQLILKQGEAQTAQAKGVAELEVRPAKGNSVAPGVHQLQVVIRNQDGPRRWYLVPTRLDVAMSEAPTVRSWQALRWTEHVRADFLKFTANPDFYAVPVAGYGSVELAQWPVQGKAKDGKFTVWELDRLAVDGQEQQFQMKLPYDLRIEHVDQSAQEKGGAAAKVEFKVRKKHTVSIGK